MSLKLWAYGNLVIGSIESLARGLRQLPRNDLSLAGVSTDTDIAYINDGNSDHTLDVYMPTNFERPWPIAVYVHGGGFKYFDKDTHWFAAAKFAKAGYLTFNVNYRLAPKHPYPAAVQDVSAALVWIAANAERFGGDLNRVLYSGESAGGNLALGAAISGCFQRPEAHAMAVWNAGIRPQVLLPACGYLGVSNPERHAQQFEIVPWMNGRIMEVTRAYLPDHATPQPAHAYANPLRLFESLGQPERAFPATFAIVGDRDPVRGDTLELGRVLEAKGLRGNHRVYAGGIHGFHAATWTSLAKRAWDDQLAFADAHMPQRQAHV